jgi:hypothetical protein
MGAAGIEPATSHVCGPGVTRPASRLMVGCAGVVSPRWGAGGGSTGRPAMYPEVVLVAGLGATVALPRHRTLSGIWALALDQCPNRPESPTNQPKCCCLPLELPTAAQLMVEPRNGRGGLVSRPALHAGGRRFDPCTAHPIDRPFPPS